MFTLVLIKNRSRAPCSGSKSERSLRHQVISFIDLNQDDKELCYIDIPRYSEFERKRKPKPKSILTCLYVLSNI